MLRRVLRIARLLVTGLVLTALACSGAATPCPPLRDRAPRAAESAEPVTAKAASPSFETELPGKTLVYVFHASRLTNLLYELDCLAELAHCSKPAFEPIWRNELGGLDQNDEQALRDWKAIRYRYGGRILKREEQPTKNPSLPLPRSSRNFETRVRLALYTADSLEKIAENLSLFLDAPDVERAVAIVKRFSDRFEPHWQKVAPALERSARAFAESLKRHGLDDFVERAARFYRAELPAKTRIHFDLLARPVHDSASNAEPVANHALVEVLSDEAPEDRLDVVLHELFHFFFASADYATLISLVGKFTDSLDPLAYPAYGVLDESLATALGNGLALERIDAERSKRRLARQHGLYDDDFIDGVSRELLRPLADEIAAGRDLGDAGFVPLYMAAVKRAFPRGMPPRAYLRPFITLYEPELEGAYDALDRIARAGQSVSSSSFDFAENASLFSDRSRWSRVFMLRRTRLDALRPWHEIVGDDAIQTLERRAKKPGAFLYAGTRKDGAHVFVFVAEDEAAMRTLVEKFGRLGLMRTGIASE